MQKTFEEFWSAYKAIQKETRGTSFLKKASGKTIGYILLLLLISIGGLTICILSNGCTILRIISIGMVVCTIPFWVSTISQIPVTSTKENTLQRISRLEILLCDYEIDYRNPEIFKLLTEYISERTKRINPFSYFIDATKSTANIAVLVVTFFSGAQQGTLTWDKSLPWIIYIVCTYFVIRLILTVFQDWLIPIIANDRNIGQRFLDDLHDLRLFKATKQ